MPEAGLIGGKCGEKRVKREMVGAIRALGDLLPEAPIPKLWLPFLRLQMLSQPYPASHWGSVSPC